ncbi:MAG: hypothetical protein ACOC44_19480 [Promethearchaeia archaeon]
MGNLFRATTKFLTELEDFERESYLEGFLYSNSLVLSQSEESPEGLLPVYILGRQKMVNTLDKTGITDLICLIWNSAIEKYEIWIYELKVIAEKNEDVDQLVKYLNIVNKPNNLKFNEILDNAKNFLEDDLISDKEIRGALCAQKFSDNVLDQLIEVNKGQNTQISKKLVAVKINRYPVDNNIFVVVEPIIAAESTPTGRRTYYDDIRDLSDDKLKRDLMDFLKQRKKDHPEKFKQLRVLLKMLSKSPSNIVTKDQMKVEWKKNNLEENDRGLAVSQVLGYKDSYSLRQILKWDIVRGDIKDNYRLREKKYGNLLTEVLGKL